MQNSMDRETQNKFIKCLYTMEECFDLPVEKCMELEHRIRISDFSACAEIKAFLEKKIEEEIKKLAKKIKELKDEEN